MTLYHTPRRLAVLTIVKFLHLHNMIDFTDIRFYQIMWVKKFEIGYDTE